MFSACTVKQHISRRTIGLVESAYPLLVLALPVRDLPALLRQVYMPSTYFVNDYAAMQSHILGFQRATSARLSRYWIGLPSSSGVPDIAVSRGRPGPSPRIPSSFASTALAPPA